MRWRTKPLRGLLAASLVLAVSLAAYVGSVRNEFVWEDDGLVVRDRSIRSLSNVGSLFSPEYWRRYASPLHSYRPVRQVSFALDFAAWELNPFGYHATNVALHAANAVLVWWLASVVFGRGALPVVAALTFSLHPANTEVVAWVKNRGELLAAFFLWLTWIVFTKKGTQLFSPQKRAASPFFCCVAFFALAVMSKESALVLLAALVIQGFQNEDRGARRRWLAGVAGLCVVGLVWVAFRATWLKGGRFGDGMTGEAMARHLLMIPVAAQFYLGLLLFPLGLNPDHTYALPQSLSDGRVLWGCVSAAFAAAVAYGALGKCRSGRLACMVLALFLLPALNTVGLKGRLLAEQRLYLCTVGFGAAVGAWVGLGAGRARGRRLAMVMVTLIAFAALAVQRSLAWRGEASLWRDCLRKSPTSFTAHFNRGVALAEDRVFARAEKEFLAARRLRPEHEASYRGMGALRKSQGRYEESVAEFRRAAALSPKSAEAHNNLGAALALAGRHGEALAAFDAALANDPRSLEARQNRGMALERLGRWDEALAEYGRALGMGPTQDARLHCERGDLYRRMGAAQQAVSEYEAAIRARPGYLLSYCNLGALFLETGDAPKAEATYRKALQLDPTLAMAHYGLAMSLFRLGRDGEARGAMRRAVELDPSLGDRKAR